MTGLPQSSRELFDSILVVVDRYSKRVWTIPTHATADARLTAEQFIRHIVYENETYAEEQLLRRSNPTPGLDKA